MHPWRDGTDVIGRRLVPFKSKYAVTVVPWFHYIVVSHLFSFYTPIIYHRISEDYKIKLIILQLFLISYLFRPHVFNTL